MTTESKIRAAYNANLAAGMDAKTAAVNVAADMVIAAHAIRAASTDAARREARDAAIANMPTTRMEEVAGEWRGLGNLRDAVPTKRWAFATV